jgi:hypothetical protein
MKKALIILTVILVSCFFYFRSYEDRRLKKEANVIVTKIEDFKKKYNRLPNSLNELDIHHEDLFYNKFDSVNYIVWFGTDLGESMTYYSDSKKWEEAQRGFK